MTHGERPSTTSLIGDAVRQATELVATEISLVRLEASEKLVLALASVGSIIVAAIFIIVALIFLLQGLVEVLVHAGFAAFGASFMVGGGIGFFALVAIMIASRNLRLVRLKPGRTMGQVKIAKDIVRGRPT